MKNTTNLKLSENGSTVIIILILGAVMAITLAWTMNLVYFEKRMEEGRRLRSGLESLISSLRSDLQDGFQCSRYLVGQNFPHWDNLTNPDGNEVDIAIRNYKWLAPDGTFATFPEIRGDNPLTPTIDEGTAIPQLGIRISRITVRRGLITPGTLPLLRPSGTNTQQQWGQDRWYRFVQNSGAIVPNNYGDIRTIINNVSGLDATTTPIGIETGAIDTVSPFGMVFGAEVIIEAKKEGSTALTNNLNFNPRDPNQPLKRIQVYVKATLANRLGTGNANASKVPIILGCYGPSTAAHLCDQSGGNYSTMPIFFGGVELSNLGRNYCQPDQNCWTRKVPVPATLPRDADGKSAIFSATEIPECEFPPAGAIPVGTIRSPFRADPLGAGALYTCNWCNPNPIDPLPVVPPDYQHIKPNPPGTAKPQQAPNEFGGSTYPYF